MSDPSGSGPPASKRLNIAFYHASLPRHAGRKGGVEAAVHRLANALVDRGQVGVTVYSSGEPPEDARYAHRRVLDRTNGMQFTRLLLSPWLLNGLDFRSADVLHLHGDDWFFLRRRRASVRTMYGSAWHEARTASTWKRRFMMTVCFWLEKLSVCLATVNVSIGRQTEAIYGADHVVGMSVDRTIYRPGPKASVPTILFVGGWNERKRGSVMYRVFIDEVLAKIPDARLLMVTDECPHHPAVTWLRNVPDEELSRHMASSWVFGYPSLYEGFGIAYIEAMACGTAIVTTPNAGADEVLDSGRYGIIVDDGGFGPALVTLLTDQERRQALEHAGVERATDFDIDRIAAANEAVYAEAVKRYNALLE